MFTQFQTSKTVNREKNRFNCLAAATSQPKGYNLKAATINRKIEYSCEKCSQVGQMRHRTESSGIQSTKDLKPF
jgi:hypothetical protein